MVYTLRFFLNAVFFHNSNLFGSCVIHVLYTGCAKIGKKKKFRRQKITTLKTLRYVSVLRPSSGSYIFLARVTLEIITY